MNQGSGSMKPHILATAGRADWFLEDLVRLVNSTGVSIGITLSAGGMLISGKLASGHAYFEGVAEDLSAVSSDDEVAAVLKSTIAKLASVYSPDKDSVSSSPRTRRRLTYIHLREARIFHPSGAPIPSNRGVWWRGRLSEVEGFCFGQLEHEPDGVRD